MQDKAPPPFRCVGPHHWSLPALGDLGSDWGTRRAALPGGACTALPLHPLALFSFLPHPALSWHPLPPDADFRPASAPPLLRSMAPPTHLSRRRP